MNVVLDLLGIAFVAWALRMAHRDGMERLRALTGQKEGAR